MDCPCGSGRTHAECCGPYLAGERWPETAEALMRARYSAFATGNVDFIHDSYDPGSRDELDRQQTETWSKQSEWLGFELIDSEGGGVDEDTGTIEFIAHYKLQGDELAHHELAQFEKVDGKWYFMDGRMLGQPTYRREAPKVGRNDPCPCGSGKKYKKCCGGAGVTQA